MASQRIALGTPRGALGRKPSQAACLPHRILMQMLMPLIV
jgi:hypothetical protein